MMLGSKRRQRRKERQASILKAHEEREAEDNLMRIFATPESAERIYIRDIIGCDQGLDIPPATLPGGTHPAKKVLLDYRHRRSIPWPPTPEEAEKLAKLAEEAPRVTIKESA